MIANEDPFGGNFDGGHAQIGIYRNGNPSGCHCFRFAWEWSDYREGFPFYRALWGSPAIGTFYLFKVDIYTTDGKAHMIGPDQQIPPNNRSGAEPVSDRIDNLWAQPTSELGGEILRPQTDFEGAAAAHQVLSHLQERH